MVVLLAQMDPMPQPVQMAARSTETVDLGYSVSKLIPTFFVISTIGLR
jgi:hypothetical protein